MSARASCCVLLILAVAPPVEAQAQAECEPDPDTVVLRSGERLTGVVAEYAPDGSVTIALSSGETRRLAADEVSSVVPAEARNDVDAAREAPASAGRPRAVGRRVRVRLRSEDGSPLTYSIERYAYRPSSPNLAGGRRTETSLLTGFDVLCRAPCEAMVLEGPQLFGVARPGEDPVMAVALTRIDGPSTVVARLRDRSALRTFGLVFAIVGAVAGGAIAVVGGLSDDRTTRFRTLGGGALLAISFALVGGVLMWQPDTAEVRTR